MINLSMDITLLVSILNTKLRNQYQTLVDLCEDLEIDYESVSQKLNMNQFIYDSKENQIRKV